MPFFKTTNNIVTDHGEHFDENWMDSDTLILPPKDEWTYDRELTIDDIDLWEVIFEDHFGISAVIFSSRRILYDISVLLG